MESDALRLAATILAGLVTGGVLGLTGAGGSILTLPALVGVAGLAPHQAVAASLLSVGGSAAAGAAANARDGRLRWRAVLPFAAIAGLAAIGGGRVGRLVPARGLMIAFGALALFIGWRMHRRSATDGAGAAAPAAPAARASRSRLVLTALAVGLLSGVLGVGGGFLIVPALVAAVGLALPEAIATSLGVIALNCAGALLGALSGLDGLPWGRALPFVLASILGSRAGATLGGRWPVARLRTAFSVLAFAVGAGTLAVYLRP
jgi:hypothetical protein